MATGQPLYFNFSAREFDVFEKIRTVTARLTVPDVSNPGFNCVGYPQIILRWNDDDGSGVVLVADVDQFHQDLIDWISNYPGVSNAIGGVLTVGQSPVPPSPPAPPE